MTRSDRNIESYNFYDIMTYIWVWYKHN